MKWRAQSRRAKNRRWILDFDLASGLELRFCVSILQDGFAF